MKHVFAITILFLIHALFLHSVIAQDNTQWKLPEGAKARPSKGHTDTVNALAFTTNGRTLAN